MKEAARSRTPFGPSFVVGQEGAPGGEGAIGTVSEVPPRRARSSQRYAAAQADQPAPRDRSAHRMGADGPCA